MAKLGYTWYPKDWGNSESVFELTLVERGLYRELIDMAMLNDNKTEINIKVWSRKFGSTEDEIDNILSTLEDLHLIVCTDANLFIPSCESRLQFVRAGSNGGKKSKPTPKPNSKPIPKPFESLCEKNEKPTANQREKKEKRKEREIENNIPLFSEFLDFAKQHKQNVDSEKLSLKFSSWVSNDWKDGNDKKIVNWKSKLLNTLPYIEDVKLKRFDFTNPNQMHR